MMLVHISITMQTENTHKLIEQKNPTEQTWWQRFLHTAEIKKKLVFLRMIITLELTVSWAVDKKEKRIMEESFKN